MAVLIHGDKMSNDNRNDKQPVLSFNVSAMEETQHLADHYVSENILRELVGEEIAKKVDDIVEGYGIGFQTVRIYRDVRQGAKSQSVKCYNAAWLDATLSELGIGPDHFYHFKSVELPTPETTSVNSLMDVPNSMLSIKLPDGSRDLFYHVVPKFNFMAASANVLFGFALSELFRRDLIKRGIKASFDPEINSKAITRAARALSHYRAPGRSAITKNELCLKRGRINIRLNNGIRIQSVNERELEVTAQMTDSKALILGDVKIGASATRVRISSDILSDICLDAFIRDRVGIGQDLRRILLEAMLPYGIKSVFVKLDAPNEAQSALTDGANGAKDPEPHLTEFMWACSRTEGDGSMVSVFEDKLGLFLPDIRNEQQLPITPSNVESFNLGISNGIVALLDHLYENGYTLIDSEGTAIQTNQSLGQEYRNWLKAPTYHSK